jgi:hypothetical protein
MRSFNNACGWRKIEPQKALDVTGKRCLVLSITDDRGNVHAGIEPCPTLKPIIKEATNGN